MPPRKKTQPPGVAEPPENTPGATDGKPDEDELQRRREAKSGTSVAARVDEDDPTPETELFPLGALDGDPAVSLKNLIKAGSTVRRTASMGTAAVPIKGTGFFDPEEEVTLLVRALPGGIMPVPTHEKSDSARHKIKEWRLTQSLTPIFVQEADRLFTREQVLEMFYEANVPASMVKQLLGPEPEAVQA